MKKILYSILLLLFISCKKEDNSQGTLYVNNQFNATVIHLSDTTKINANGLNARIGCSTYGISTYAYGTDFNNQRVSFSLPVGCISNPGTFTIFSCEFRPNNNSQTSPIYENIGVSDPGSITFTKMSGNYAEGYFNAVCKIRNTSDSVFVKGNFKGFLDL
jgi:hypothetical protein